jgi:3-oxoacyl-[acyl-carrier-protein] synthase III
MEKINAVITGVGGFVPRYILDNEEMSHIVDTTDEWIMERIGVKTRHILKPDEGNGTSFMMKKAVRELLQKTKVDPDSIECIIAATTTPDYHFPSTASLIIGDLELKHCFGFDMEAACSNFLYAMELAASMIVSGRHNRIIVCGGDFMSSMTNYQDRTTCPIFGDGAGCVLMEASTEPYGLVDSYLRVDGKGYPYLHMEAGGSANPPSHETVDKRLHFVYQDGRPVFKAAVTKMSDAVETIAKRNHLTKDDIAWIVPHQANVRIEQAVARRLNVPEDHVMINIDHMANTSAGTLPLCLWEYEKRLKKGDNLIFTAFGAGFTWGASYLKWFYDGDKVGQ